MVFVVIIFIQLSIHTHTDTDLCNFFLLNMLATQYCCSMNYNAFTYTHTHTYICMRMLCSMYCIRIYRCYFFRLF